MLRIIILNRDEGVAPRAFCIVPKLEGEQYNVYLFWYNKIMNGKQVIALLKKEGWTLARIEGSHHIMEKKGMPRGVPVPVRGSKDLGSGLLKAIERQTGVKLK